MKKILLLRSVSQNFGGVERQVLMIAKRLAEIGLLEPIIVTSRKNSAFSDSFQSNGIVVEEAPHLVSSLQRGSSELQKIIKKYKPCIVQSHGFRESITARIARLNNKRFKHIARIHTYIDCSWIPEWKKKAYHCLERLTESGVDHFVPINQFAADELVKRSWISKKKISIIPDGVPQIGNFDKNANFTLANNLKIAMIANLVEHKGHDVLISGLAELKKRGLIVHVRLIGGEHTNSKMVGGSFTNHLLQMSRDAGVVEQIEFYGYSENIYEAIKNFPVVVLPSDSEGTPNCLLEAMSIGKIVIGTNVGGVPEFITNKVNGFTHDKQDSATFADIIESLRKKLPSELDVFRINGYETWKQRFSVDAMINRFEEFYRLQVEI
jgi:glycosyltransferase involved in cell wall biosynthesis